MTDQSTTNTLSIPREIQKKFPELIELIKGSKSMNSEERQYWINILPIMTTDQVQNLRDILENEKRQLAKIEQKYSSIHSTNGNTDFGKDHAKRKSERIQKEKEHEKKDEELSEELLQKISEI